MINSAPNNSKYIGGNYIPRHKDKVVKLNNKGGVFYRSSWEKRIMTWLDSNENIIRWGAECLRIPYQMKHFENGDTRIKEHCYYPDFYYELKTSSGIKKIVSEVKPFKEYKMVVDLNEKILTVPDGTKKLKNFEYDLKMAYKNKEKWETMIRWCDVKGYEFQIITEMTMKKYNI